MGSLRSKLLFGIKDLSMSPFNLNGAVAEVIRSSDGLTIGEAVESLFLSYQPWKLEHAD